MSEVPCVREVCIGQFEIDVRGVFAIERLPVRGDRIDVIIGRVQPVLVRGAQRAEQAVSLRPQAPAVAPGEMLAVLFVEPALLLPDVMRALVVANERRRRLRLDCRGKRGIRSG